MTDDPDAHAARTAATGIKVLAVPHDNAAYLRRSYEAYDPERHVRTFASYAPWAP